MCMLELVILVAKFWYAGGVQNLGNSLVNDLCCLVTCVVWHVFHVGMMEMEECGSTFNRDCLPRVVQALHRGLARVVQHGR